MTARRAAVPSRVSAVVSVAALLAGLVSAAGPARAGESVRSPAPRAPVAGPVAAQPPASAGAP
ncbi:hypothetical protein ACWF94_28680, partial [Streptomyces sp. NPDC055078]